MLPPRKLTSPSHLQSHARSNRKSPTLPEQKLWQLLRNSRFNNLKFRRQATIAPYIVDFACLSKMLILELDGQSHDNRGTYDKQRQQFLESKGYKVLRFSNDEVLDHPDLVLEAIQKQTQT
ncbi:endonuclease domain-containing protein [Lacunimicrobium album]